MKVNGGSESTWTTSYTLPRGLLQKGTRRGVDQLKKCVYRYFDPQVSNAFTIWWVCHWMNKLQDDVLWLGLDRCVKRYCTLPLRGVVKILQKKTSFGSNTRKAELPQKRLVSLTFFSLSIHLLIAIVEDPLRSLRAKMASLMRAIVAMIVAGQRKFVVQKFFSWDLCYQAFWPEEGGHNHFVLDPREFYGTSISRYLGLVGSFLLNEFWVTWNRDRIGT